MPTFKLDVVGPITHQAVQINCMHDPVCYSSDEIQKYLLNAYTCFYIQIKIYLYEIYYNHMLFSPLSQLKI